LHFIPQSAGVVASTLYATKQLNKIPPSSGTLHLLCKWQHASE
jgi:hypothetical protein